MGSWLQDIARQIIEAAWAPIVIRDPYGRWLACSRQAKVWRSATERVSRQTAIHSWFDESAHHALARVDRIVLRSKVPRTFSLMLRRPDENAPRLFTARTAPVVTGEGRVALLVSSFTPSNMQDEIVQSYRQREVMWDVGSRAANLGFYTWDDETEVCTYCSEQLAAMHELTVEEYHKRCGTTEKLVEHMHPDDRAQMYKQPNHPGEFVEQPNHPGEFVEHRNTRITTAKGKLRYLRSRDIILEGASGEHRREMGVVQDITEEKEKEIRLEAAKEEVEKALADLKQTQERLVRAEKLASLGRLVAGMAHELNTPVGIMRTAASHLGNLTSRLDGWRTRPPSQQEVAALTRQYEELSGIIERCSRQAADLIDRFKQLSAGATVAPRDSIRLKPCLEGILATLQQRVGQAGHALRLVCPADIEVHATSNVLFQIVTNLVTNTLQHGFGEVQGGGHIVITVRKDSRGTVVLSYSDNGRGIPEDIIPHLFEPFFTTARGRGGTGLGLHIVYTLVTSQLGGKVTVANRERRGALFRIVIPPGSEARASSAEIGTAIEL